MLRAASSRGFFRWFQAGPGPFVNFDAHPFLVWATLHKVAGAGKPGAVIVCPVFTSTTLGFAVVDSARAAFGSGRLCVLACGTTPSSLPDNKVLVNFQVQGQRAFLLAGPSCTLQHRDSLAPDRGLRMHALAQQVLLANKSPKPWFPGLLLLWGLAAPKMLLPCAGGFCLGEQGREVFACLRSWGAPVGGPCGLPGRAAGTIAHRRPARHSSAAVVSRSGGCRS